MLGFKQNQKITSSSHRIPYLGREFTISFIMVVKQPTAKWENVIHFAQGDKPWPRIPAVFIGTGNKLQVHMQHLWKRSDTVLKTNRIMKIDISQTLTPKQVYAFINSPSRYLLHYCHLPQYLVYGFLYSAKKYIFEVKIDNKEMYKAENTDAQIFENINIYVSDPWNPSATGNMTSLLVRTWDNEGKFNLQLFHL